MVHIFVIRRSKSIKLDTLFEVLAKFAEKIILAAILNFWPAILTRSWWRRKLKFNTKPSHDFGYLYYEFHENRIKTLTVTVLPWPHTKWLPWRHQLCKWAKTQTRTDTQTHTQTHRQTPPGFPDPNDHNTFSQWKWLNVKIAGCQRLQFLLYFKKIGIKLWLLECACCDVQIWPLWRHNLCKWFKSEMRTPRTLADIFG